MMPFSREFQEVHDTIRESCHNVNLECRRVDDIWKNSVIIQDIFELIYSSSIVVADLSGKNPNVFYEVGIAHTLGKSVIPIVQNMADIPFDLRHHRALEYLNNDQGREKLKTGLESRLKTLRG
jgi:nucleoside 2-deoxyribosyltransferase